MLFCLQSRFWDFCSKFRRDNQKLYFLCKADFGYDSCEAPRFLRRFRDGSTSGSSGRWCC